MKFLTIETIKEGQLLPRARIGLFRVVDAIVKDCPIQYAIVLRLPFKRWKQYFHIGSLQNEQGWCVYTCYAAWYKWPRKFKRGGLWVPIETDDL